MSDISLNKQPMISTTTKHDKPQSQALWEEGLQSHFASEFFNVIPICNICNINLDFTFQKYWPIAKTQNLSTKSYKSKETFLPPCSRILHFRICPFFFTFLFLILLRQKEVTFSLSAPAGRNNAEIRGSNVLNFPSWPPPKLSGNFCHFFQV